MEEFIIDNIAPIVVAATGIVTVIVVKIKRKHGYRQYPTIFKTTQYKRKFKKFDMHFNNEFKEKNNTMFK